MWHFDFEKALVDAVVLERLDDLLPDIGVVDGLRGRLVRKLGQLRGDGNDDGDDEVLGRVGEEADVFDDGAGLQDSLHLSIGNVLAVLELDQVLLPINDPDGNKGIKCERGKRPTGANVIKLFMLFTEVLSMLFFSFLASLRSCWKLCGKNKTLNLA